MFEPNSLVDVVCNFEKGNFYDVSKVTSNSTSIIQMTRLPLKGIDITVSQPYKLPIGTFYNLFSFKIFWGTLFMIPLRYKCRMENNHFSVYSKLKEYNNIRGCIKNDRWSCFTPEDNSSMLVVSNLTFTMDIRK